MPSKISIRALQQRAALLILLGERPMRGVIERELKANNKNPTIARWSEQRKTEFVIRQILHGFGVHPDKIGAVATVRALARQGINIGERALLEKMITMTTGPARAQLTTQRQNLAWCEALSKQIGATEAERLIRICVSQWRQNDQNFDKMNDTDKLAEVLRALLPSHGIRLQTP